jgi:DNA-nicking Smr family endonuclease
MSKGSDDTVPRGLTPEEADLWRRAMDRVKPLKKPRARSPATPPPSMKVSRPAAKARSPQKAVAQKKAPPPPQIMPDLVLGKTPGVDRRTTTRMRRGKLDVEARIDLHGHYQDQAHRALNGFIMASIDAGRRCVLVITGKGSRGDGGGVIRAAVPRWLGLAPLREHVLAINPAHPKDGGDGALYVLLRRKRPARPERS